MNDKSASSSGGIGFCGLLAIAFIVLKLLDKIAWSWFWVLSPLWIPIALVGTFFLLAGIVWVGAAAIGGVLGQIQARKLHRRIAASPRPLQDITETRERLRRRP